MIFFWYRKGVVKRCKKLSFSYTALFHSFSFHIKLRQILCVVIRCDKIVIIIYRKMIFFGIGEV